MSSLTALPTPPQLPPRTQDDKKPPSIPYTRDPHRLTAYLIPFPKPNLPNIAPESIPDRFFLYTPPYPQLVQPPYGEKELLPHKLQRKFQYHLRDAKTSNPEPRSWASIRGKMTTGVDWGLNKVQNSNLDFLNRVPKSKRDEKQDTLKELLILHPPSGLTEYQLRTAFTETLRRSRRKALRSAVVSTGSFPVTFVVVLFIPVPGPLEVHAAWSYCSIRATAIAHSVSGQLKDKKGGSGALEVRVKECERLRILERFLYAKCHELDPGLWPSYEGCPSEGQVLDGIGWKPEVREGEQGGVKEWEDELWEIEVAKEDLRRGFEKGAKEWGEWIELFERKPKKAEKR